MHRRAAVAIGALALAASGRGLLNGFVYDDRSIILQSPRVHHLAHLGRLWRETYWPPSMGAGLYRPITTSAYTMEWAVGHGAPWVFHATNVALYVAICLSVYALARLILPSVAAWVSAALFAVHPVHVEAVGNVVGQSELLAALGVVGAVVLYVRWRRAALALASTNGAGVLGPAWHSVVITLLIAAACLAKEHAVVAPALLAAAELWVVGDPRSIAARGRALRPLALTLTATVLAYVLVRAQVLGVWTGDRPNVVFEHLSSAGRRWTMLGIVPEWARLLFWPARLVAEYSPTDIEVFEHFSIAVLPGVVLLVGLGVLFLGAARRWPTCAFALAWLAITLLLVSNLIVPTGVVLAERTLFLPSVGAVLLIGAALARAAEHQRTVRGGWTKRALVAGDVALALLLAAGIWRSVERQGVWRSNASLFTQGVIDAPFSYRAHDVYAGLLFERGDRVGGEREARVALALYPHDAVLYRDLANEYVRGNLCVPAVPLLRRAIAEATIPTDAHLLLADCLLIQGDPVAARGEVLRGIATGGYGPIYHQLMVAIDSVRAHGVQSAPRPEAPHGDKR